MMENWPHKKILLAEDSVIMQDILRLALEKSGHRLRIASNAKEALHCLNEESFDVALIDFHLPDQTGFELVREYFRVSTQSHSPRLVALSGDAMEVLAVDRAANHFDLIMAKPFVISDLIDVIESRDSVPRPIHVRNSILAKEAQKPEAVFNEDENFHLIYFPFDFHSSFKNAVSMSIARNGAVDAIVLDRVPNEAEAIMLTKIKGMGMAAHIDRTGKLSYQSDYHIGDNFDEYELIQFLDRRRMKRDEIHESHHFSKTISENMVLSAFLKRDGLLPRVNFSEKFGILYNHILPGDVFFNHAENLVTHNQFLSSLFLNIIRCPYCESARLYPQNLASNDPRPDEIFCTDCRKNFSSFLVVETNMPRYRLSKNAREILISAQKEVEFIE